MSAGKVALAIIVEILLFFGVVAFSIYGYVNSVRGDTIKMETQLTAQYLSNQNYLSSYVRGFYEQAGLLEFQSEKLDQILLDAVKGRYDDGGFTVGSSFFTAIVESYPEASLARFLDNAGKIQDYVAAGRAGYRATQDKLLDQLRNYKSWLENDIVRSIVLRTLGFPSTNLEARVGTNVVTGEAARQKMLQIILDSKTLEAYEKGTLEPLKVPNK